MSPPAGAAGVGGRDAAPAGGHPPAPEAPDALRPGSEAELAEILKGANAPLRILGGGTCAAVGNPVAGRPLSVAGLAGITLYEPGALTLVARAGTPLAEIEATLAAEGQMLAFEPPDWRRLMGSGGAATIGGTVAMNRSGPRRVAAGAARDMLLGLRFVTGTGSIVKSGGRVMKNVTGYDLARLVAGSHGTLGVITEVALKVLPRPEAAATLVLHGLDDARAVAAMTAALATPWEVSGAAHLPQGPWDGPATLLRLEGRAAALAGRRESSPAISPPMARSPSSTIPTASRRCGRMSRRRGRWPIARAMSGG
ncbi:MAG: hypothetical protein KatS3mg118_0823 [Paracoccaceae bacterium]|nr:MAG: hypothetical protein KatS3mg118_0823 [Paracoccaceae bacterium]